MNGSQIWGMNGIDALILGVMVFSILIGLARGLVREILSLVIWALALLLAWRHYPALEPELAPWLEGPSSRAAGAFLLLALGLALAGGLLGYLLTSLVELAPLKGTVRLLGGLLGAMRGALILSMLAFLAALTPMPNEALWRDSQLVGRFGVMAEWVLAAVPPKVEERIGTL
jgi:membrane protein required for colicin V production